MKGRNGLAALLLATMCSGARADNTEICKDVDRGSPLPSRLDAAFERVRYMAAKESKDWWPAHDYEIGHAPCRGKAPTDKELRRYFKAIDDGTPEGDRQARTIHGVRFEAESPRMLALFERLTRHHSRDPEISALLTGTFKSGCKKVLCAAKEIFGKKTGPRLVFMLDRYGYNGSPRAFDSSVDWKEDELGDVLGALSDFPPLALPTQPDHQLTRFTRSTTLKIYTERETYANGSIHLFDPWEAQSPNERRGTISHEIGHVLCGQFNIHPSKTWRELSGWEKKTVTIEKDGKKVATERDVAGNPDAIVSHYGEKNPSEDCAESVEAYRYNPILLKARSPEKYALLREAVFDGLEYTSEDACRPELGLMSRVSATAKTEASTVPVPADAVAAAAKSCGPELMQALKKGSYGPEFDAPTRECLGIGLMRNAALKAASSEALKYPEFAKTALAVRVRETANPEAARSAARGVSAMLKSSFAGAIRKRDEDSGYWHNDKWHAGKPDRELCDGQFNQYSYQAAAGMNDEYSSSRFFALENRATINFIMNESCVAMRSAKPDARERFTDDEIDAALAPYFP